MQKEIHFYKDGKDFPIEEFNYYDYYHVNHISTMEAIKNGDDLIITTALTALNFHSLLINNIDGEMIMKETQIS